MQRAPLIVLYCIALVSLGCENEPIQPEVRTDVSPQPRPVVKLTVLVVDAPNMAAGIQLLRGEWAERSGGQLVVEQRPAGEVLAAAAVSADVVVFPSRYLGTFVARNALRPVRSSILQSEVFRQNDLLPLVRNRVLPYGGKVYALSLGESPLMLAWQTVEASDGETAFAAGATAQSRAAGFPATGHPDAGPPLNWQQFDLLQPKVSVSDRIQHGAAVEFLVRALGYASQRNRSSILFDPDTMQPRITSPPFLRALQEIVAVSQRPASGKRGVAVTIGWPQALPLAAASAQRVELTPVPAATAVYNHSLEIWEEPDPPAPVVILGFAGRLVSVTRSSRNAASAFELLQWLASGEIASNLSQRSESTAWWRASQVSQASLWLRGSELGEWAARAITRQLSGEHCFLLPRIPAIDDYLAHLSKAVANAKLGNLSADAALQLAADAWEATTTEQGRDSQRAAYRKHLGYDDYAD